MSDRSSMKTYTCSNHEVRSTEKRQRRGWLLPKQTRDRHNPDEGKGARMFNVEEDRKLPKSLTETDPNEGPAKSAALKEAVWEAVRKLDARGTDLIPLHIEVARKVAQAK